MCLFIACGLAITKTAFGILRGSGNTYSLSRLQMAAWTWLILSALIAVAVARLWDQAGSAADALNIYVPSNLFIVMGISFFTGAAAPALLSLKTTTAPTAGQLETARQRMDESNVVSNGQLIVRSLAETPHFGDLVEGDDVATAGTVDISKVQQLLITILLLGVYFAMLWDLFASSGQDGLLWNIPGDQLQNLINQGSLRCGFNTAQEALKAGCGTGWTALPDFPGSLVTLLAVSHGGYLAYKAAPRAAPDGAGTTGTSATPDQAKAVG